VGRMFVKCEFEDNTPDKCSRHMRVTETHACYTRDCLADLLRLIWERDVAAACGEAVG